MRSYTALLALGALFSTVSAVPMKRDVKQETVTAVDTVVEEVTATVWVDATAAPTAPAAYVAHTSSSAAPAVTSAASAPGYNPIQAPPSSPVVVMSSKSSEASPPPPSTTSVAPIVVPTSAPPAPPAPPAPTTSSSPPPPPTTSAAPAPPPTTTAAPPPPPTTTSAAAPAPSSASSGGSSSGGEKFSGADLTYYDVGLGSCGFTNTDSESVVAVAAGMMNKATMCGKSITISYGGKQTTAKIVDTCPGCSGTGLDLSPAAFKELADESIGRAHGAEWWYN